ncbi:hypothetical protein F751_5358 [Auxenochlorella protothecoides]|uniref:Uncharacterized protein n=1 Tax=Auxenochlorella protothecoides TaxID=3075 RepID=A0A087SRU1_AUXPR|nr:hypothetical protein F751_5358 [Auxenochlorella protothecoides]KFM28445.1 hypothetical protein F751_5358 [Auxenochlorella protothecoides]
MSSMMSRWPSCLCLPRLCTPPLATAAQRRPGPGCQAHTGPRRFPRMRAWRATRRPGRCSSSPPPAPGRPPGGPPGGVPHPSTPGRPSAGCRPRPRPGPHVTACVCGRGGPRVECAGNVTGMSRAGSQGGKMWDERSPNPMYKRLLPKGQLCSNPSTPFSCHTPCLRAKPIGGQVVLEQREDLGNVGDGHLG